MRKYAILAALLLGGLLGSRFERPAQAISPSATTGWTLCTMCSGTPTGVPATVSSDVTSMAWDYVGKKLYVYTAGWNQVH